MKFLKPSGIEDIRGEKHASEECYHTTMGEMTTDIIQFVRTTSNVTNDTFQLEQEVEGETSALVGTNLAPMKH